MAVIHYNPCHIGPMHITRKTNQELVILDSSIWLSVSLLCVSAFATYRIVEQGKKSGLWAVGFLLLFALFFWRREVVVFDGARQQAEWRRRRAFKVAGGTIPFSEITGIGMEATSAKNNVLVYRLTILTANGSVPMSDNYAGDRQRYEKLKAEILDFLKIDSDEVKTAQTVDGIADEASVRSLLQQGRRIDAIQLVRSMQNVSLVEATNLVAKMMEQMKTAQ